MTTKPLSASLESHLDMAPADGTDISTLLYLYVFRCLTIQHPALASGLSLAYSVLSVYTLTPSSALRGTEISGSKPSPLSLTTWPWS